MWQAIEGNFTEGLADTILRAGLIPDPYLAQ